MANDQDRLVATITKNSREEIRAQLRTFKGHRSIDLRVFASNGVDTIATGKGVSIKPALIRPVIEALHAAERAAVEEGLITPSEGI